MSMEVTVAKDLIPRLISLIKQGGLDGCDSAPVLLLA
jgi:hypothetical protein